MVKKAKCTGIKLCVWTQLNAYSGINSKQCSQTHEIRDSTINQTKQHIMRICNCEWIHFKHLIDENYNTTAS